MSARNIIYSFLGDRQVYSRGELELIVELAEWGLASLRETIESACPFTVRGRLADGWWNTAIPVDSNGEPVEISDEDDAILSAAISLLERAGEIERRPGEPHMVRFK